MKLGNTKAGVFKPEKKLQRKKRLVLVVEILVVCLLIGGTISLFFGLGKVSPEGFTKVVSEIFSLKNFPEQEKSLSFDEKIKTSIDGKPLTVISIKNSEDKFWVVESKEGTKVIFDENKDLSEQVRTLQTLFSKAKIDKKKVVLADFRFEKLVVQYDR